MPTYVSVAVPNKLILGTIHKRRRQFFWIFDTPLPHVSSFLVLSVANFDQFLTPPIRRRRLWTALKYIPFFSDRFDADIPSFICATPDSESLTIVKES